MNLEKKDRSQEKCFSYSLIIPAVEVQARTDSKNFPLRSNGRMKRRKGKCNRTEVAAKPGVQLPARAKKKSVLSKANKL